MYSMILSVGSVTVGLSSSVSASASLYNQTGNIIVLINPNSNAKATKSMADLARTETEGVAVVEEYSNEGAPSLLTTPEDMQNAASAIVKS